MILAALAAAKSKLFIYGGIALAVLLVVFGIYRKGENAAKASIEAGMARKAMEIKDAQLRATRNRARTDDDLDRVLRDGGF